MNRWFRSIVSNSWASNDHQSWKIWSNECSVQSIISLNCKLRTAFGNFDCRCKLNMIFKRITWLLQLLAFISNVIKLKNLKCIIKPPYHKRFKECVTIFKRIFILKLNTKLNSDLLWAECDGMSWNSLTSHSIHVRATVIKIPENWI